MRLVIISFATLIVTVSTKGGIEPADHPPHVRLTKDLLDPSRYDKRVRPAENHTIPTKVRISMSLYQILEVNEPSQNIELNLWVIQKWQDDFLGWNPAEYGNINMTILPYQAIWLPDTYLYNSVVMSRDATERYINVVVSTSHWEGQKGAEIKFMYPAIYKTTCRLNIQYFPYDQQNCTLTISSWTSSKSALDYYADVENINMAEYIPSEEWDVVSFRIYRQEQKFACCPEPWVLLHASLVIRRKPLYYIVNLVIPTAIITIVAVTGFFTPASTSSERTEKVNLGITTLLAMSILMLMVSDQMPTTSDFVPLIGWFYLSIIIVISVGTFLTSIILTIQGQKVHFRPVPGALRRLFFARVASWLWVQPPAPLVTLWLETNTDPDPKKSTGPPKGLKGQKLIKPELVESDSGQPLVTVASRMSNRPTEEGGEKSDNGAMKGKWLMLSSSDALSRTPEATTPARLSSLTPSPAPDDGNTFKYVSAAAGAALTEQKLKRQYALEWEFLATVLDRIMLVFFCGVVGAVTIGMIVIGNMAKRSYELADAAESGDL